MTDYALMSHCSLWQPISTLCGRLSPNETAQEHRARNGIAPLRCESADSRRQSALRKKGGPLLPCCYSRTVESLNSDLNIIYHWILLFRHLVGHP